MCIRDRISEQRGVDPASQVLICGGKTLKDGDALASSVAAGGFLVLMVKVGRSLAGSLGRSLLYKPQILLHLRRPFFLF